MMPTRKFFFFLSGFLFYATGMRSEEIPSNSNSSEVVVHPVRRDVTKWIDIPGNTEAEVEVALYSRAAGFLRDFNLDIGDLVTPGQTIGTIEAPELDQDVKLAEAQRASALADVKTAEAAVKSALSSVKAAQANVERVKSHGAEINEKEAELKIGVSKSKAEWAKAEKLYERTQKLFSTNAATDLERENQESTVGVFKAGVAVAEGKLLAIPTERDVLKREVEAAQDSVESAQAVVESAQAAIESAKGKLGITDAAVQRAKVLQAYTHIVVPPLGLSKTASVVRVNKRFVSNGDLITAGAGARSGMQPIVQLIVTDPIRIVADVPESDVAAVIVGTSMLVTIYGKNKEAPLAGKIVRVAPMLSQSTRTLRVEMDLPNSDHALSPGMMANIEIATDVHKNVLALPASAIQTNKLGSAVFAVESGKLKKIAVKLGVSDHGVVEVSAPELTEATTIVKETKAGMIDGGNFESAKK